MEKSQKATRDLSPDYANSGEKQRADAVLLARGLARSRQRARDLIADGRSFGGRGAHWQAIKITGN